MDKMMELSKKYGEKPYLRSVINLIPYVGGSLDILLTDKWNAFYQRRIENMLDQLSTDLSTIEDSKVNHEYLESEEFFDLIQKILKESIQTRLDNKRKLYSKVIRDSISNQKSTAETESLFEIISSLYEKDLFLLFQIQAYITKTSNFNFSGQDIQGYLSNDQFDLNETVRSLYRFSYLGLLDYKTTKLTLRSQIQFSKTPLFDRIHKYLTESN